MRLKDKTAIVTGAASGLGEGIVRRFAAEGARVILCDIDEEKGRAVTASIGECATFQKLDVSQENDWVTAISNTDQLDILVNNAGVTSLCNIEEINLETFRQEMDIDVFGLLLGCKHAIAKMKKQGNGSIINMSSSCAVRAEMEMIIYSAAKAAVSSVTKSVAMHCAKRDYGIRCNAILPGLFHTPILDQQLARAPDPEEALKRWSAKMPIGRLGKVEEIAAMAVYLASDESGFTTGAELSIDGGATI
jgi:NAD(P)-dependent dehydrogenase (short-subunit alcohol dehydrogenase family)